MAITELQFAERRLRRAVAGGDQHAAVQALDAYTACLEAVLQAGGASDAAAIAEQAKGVLEWALKVTRATRAGAEAELARVVAVSRYERSA